MGADFTGSGDALPLRNEDDHGTIEDDPMPDIDGRGRARSAADREKEEIRIYVEDQVDEEVVHLEKVGSELVMTQRHDIWDVHCADSRWWVLTNPTFYYSQDDFKSRDVVLSFHVGLMVRMWSQQERRIPVAPGLATLLPGSWRRWQQAFEAYDSGDEAENFQSVGMRLRECLLSFVDETCDEEMVPRGKRPRSAAPSRIGPIFWPTW